MDTKQMIAAVAERYRVLLGPDDPAMIIVALNEMALRAATAELLELTDKKSEAITSQLDKELAKIRASRKLLSEVVTKSEATLSKTIKWHQWHLAGASAGCLIIGLLIGHFLR